MMNVLKVIFSFLCMIALTMACAASAFYLCSPILDTSIGKEYPFIYNLCSLVTLFFICCIIFKIADKFDSEHVLPASHEQTKTYQSNNQISHNISCNKAANTTIHPHKHPQNETLQSSKSIIPIRYTAQQICAMNWREFEFFIAKVLNEHDYATRVTTPKNDGGKDIIATRGKILFYIECKHWQRQSVGREVLQKLVGAAAANNVREIIFITTSSYADTGIQYKYELNRAGTFHLQLWSMRDILALANHTPLSVRSLRTLSQRNDKITSREGDIIYYSFGHPSTRCSIDVKLGNIYIDDQNRFSHMPYQSFHMSNTWDYCLSKNIFFEEVRSPDRPDLIYFHTDAKHGRFESVRIIGCYGGRIQELFNPYVDELSNLGENCSILIKDTLGETCLVISGSKNTVALQWNGSEYVIQQSTRGRRYS